jgi:hypothetical protein
MIRVQQIQRKGGISLRYRAGFVLEETIGIQRPVLSRKCDDGQPTLDRSDFGSNEWSTFFGACALKSGRNRSEIELHVICACNLCPFQTLSGEKIQPLVNGIPSDLRVSYD